MGWRTHRHANFPSVARCQRATSRGRLDWMPRSRKGSKRPEGQLRKLKVIFASCCLSGWLKLGRQSRFQTDTMSIDDTVSTSRAQSGETAMDARRLLSQSAV